MNNPKPADVLCTGMGSSATGEFSVANGAIGTDTAWFGVIIAMFEGILTCSDVLLTVTGLATRDKTGTDGDGNVTIGDVARYRGTINGSRGCVSLGPWVVCAEDACAECIPVFFLFFFGLFEGEGFGLWGTSWSRRL